MKINVEQVTELRKVLAESLLCAEIKIYSTMPNTVLNKEQYKFLWEKNSRHRNYYETYVYRKSCFFDIKNNEVKIRFINLLKNILGEYIENFQFSVYSRNSSYGNPTEETLNNDLMDVINSLIHIAILCDIDTAITKFLEAKKNNRIPYKKIITLKGISSIDSKVDIYNGITLVPSERSSSHTDPYACKPYYFSSVAYPGHLGELVGESHLLIDYFISPVFTKYSKNQEDGGINYLEKIASSELEGFDIDKFLYSLSLIFNNPIERLLDFSYTDDIEFMGIRANSSYSYRDASSCRNVVNFESKKIPELLRLYKELLALDKNISKIITMVIPRWIKAKKDKNIIDLMIAFESICINDSSSELSYRLGHRVAWYLGDNKEHRQQIFKKFKNVYKMRSEMVHTGKIKALNNNTNLSILNAATGDITYVEDLCKDLILAIIKNNKTPNWDDLIMG